METYLEIFTNTVAGMAKYQWRQIIFDVPESANGLKLKYDFGNIFTGTKLASWNIDYHFLSFFHFLKKNHEHPQRSPGFER